MAVTQAPLVAVDADVAQIADMIVMTWQEIEAALSPILGQRGVAALYKRSRHLVGPLYPWLADLHEGVRTSIDFAALESALMRQSSTDAAAAGRALLQTFRELLTGLIGPSLTERLLRSTGASSFSHPSSESISP